MIDRALEIWASPDPTVARIRGIDVRDQLRDTGHEARAGDIDRLADLGVSASRYPVLWEKVAPHHPDSRDYRWTDARLHALRERGVDPIVTLLHHGSGPAYTSLVDPEFPELLADYAEATARRYPWVKRWTPVNEPLTTARFSTLYGNWYPNKIFDHAAFGEAIVNQMLGFALAAERIRNVVPDASFLLTEDLQNYVAEDAGAAGHAFHGRERSYLSCELLQGRIAEGHAMHRYLREACGVPQDRLSLVARRGVAPDVVGWDYYPYSERLLETAPHGEIANKAMVEHAPERLDMRPLLRDAYRRLRLPFALAEVHTFGDEYERARWLLERYYDALDARANGIPIVGFGAWAAFGLVDWRSLLCREDDAREDGIYTCPPAGREPQRTLVADVLTAIARGTEIPLALDRDVWWGGKRAA